jgi:hypothetical protein
MGRYGTLAFGNWCFQADLVCMDDRWSDDQSIEWSDVVVTSQKLIVLIKDARLIPAAIPLQARPAIS